MSQPVAIVTGASRGIGRGIAEQLGADGYAVVVNYHSRSELADQVVSAIREQGGRAFSLQGSVAVEDDRQRLVEFVLEQLGRLDLLVNNAGITSPGRKDLLDSDEASWDLVFDTNLKGPFFLAQRCAKAMIQLVASQSDATPKIVNVSSISAFAVSANRVDYCIAKAGMQMMTWQLACRLAEYGIGVFEVCPGVIESDMTAPVKEKYDRLIADGMSPIRRWGKATDVAKAVSAIAANSFPFSTGERIHVDGGFHIRQL